MIRNTNKFTGDIFSIVRSLFHKQDTGNAKTCSQQNNFFFQPKLSINRPNDVYEQEADAMADKVMQTGAFHLSFSEKETFFKSSNNPLSFGEGRGEVIQRKCTECEEEEKKVQRKEGNNTDSSPLQTGNNISSLSGGKPLGNEERSFFESRMGYDFSNVRIYNDTGAHQSAKNINALAYTHGNDIVFAQNQYQPNTDEGKKLLAHELTHVVQQNGDGVSLKRAPDMIQRAMDKDPSALDDDQLKSEYDAYNEYVHNIDPADYTSEEDNMNYFLALEKELKKRCVKSKPSHPEKISDKLIDRITGKYASIDGDPGEGKGFYKPYLAPEGQCTVGYGHVIFPKSDCTIDMEKNSCTCAGKWNLSGEPAARKLLRDDMQVHVNEVNKKIKVDLNETEFDAMVDLSAHVGSMPADFANYVNENWCTNKQAVRERYLKTAITMKDKKTGKMKVMQNFIDRRKRRAW
ncbi:MAG TPA: DUF4157 domain-containing protein [Parafilimonas sp.]|nr:DUF4157 domain-containing protein [Parafilimonas sp.]